MSGASEAAQAAAATVERDAGPLAGLRVVDLSDSIVGAQMSQLLADFGADVAQVEKPGGSALRTQPAWPFWGRGKRSIALDLKQRADLDVARGLAARADVWIETWRPGVAERLGLGYDELAASNPRLVYASVTGFGRNTPLSQLKCYEPVVLAKIGALHAFSALSDRPGPSFVSTPYTAWSGAQLALQGVLAALYERESSGRGQRVESTMLQGLLCHDTWNWLIYMIGKRYPEAFKSTDVADRKALVPNSPMLFRLLTALSADGVWMQFSQTTERLWQAFLRLTKLDAVLAEPGFENAPTHENPAVRVAFWEKALASVRTKTYSQWLADFEREPDVWAEQYRNGDELLHHPQMIHDEQTLTLRDPVLGQVQQPGPLVKLRATPAQITRSAPALDEHGAALRAELRSAAPLASGATDSGSSRPPLAGITVIELGTFYAAPFGATLLADLGARVIKVEAPSGDPIRSLMPFPELSGVKVMQGKESVAVDMRSERGREIVHALVRRADAVLQTFRAGVAERHRYAPADLLAVNPNLVYLSAPGYGVDGPMGARPAFAPTMGAGAGLGYRNVGGPGNLPRGTNLTLEDVKRYSLRISMAAMSVGHADGFSALGVGTALMLGLLAKRRGAPGQAMMTSMLSTMAHALSEDMVEYEGRAAMAVPDPQLLGLGARWRLYETQEEWVFLAAPEREDWQALAKAMDLALELESRDAELARALEERFRTKPARTWERELTALDIACVEVARGPVEQVVMLDGKLGETLGIVTPQTHPVIGDYPRLAPVLRFSRSGCVAGPAPLCGAHTDAVLGELGYSAAQLAELREAKVIG